MKIIDWRDGSHHLLQSKFTRQIPPDPDLYRATDKSDFKISQQALKMPGHHVKAPYKPIAVKKPFQVTRFQISCNIQKVRKIEISCNVRSFFMYPKLSFSHFLHPWIRHKEFNPKWELIEGIFELPSFEIHFQEAKMSKNNIFFIMSPANACPNLMMLHILDKNDKSKGLLLMIIFRNFHKIHEVP